MTHLEEDVDPSLPVILTGNSFSFSVGFDMKLIFEMKKQEIKEYLNLFHNAVEKLYSSPRIHIAAITGHTIGGGLTIAQACDERIISAESTSIKIGFGQVQYGLPLSSVAFHIANREATMTDALYESVFSGKLYNPSEALHLMLATNFVDFDEEILDKSVERISNWTGHGATPLALTKKLLKGRYLSEKRELEISKILDEKFVEQMFDPVVREAIAKKFKI